MNTDIILAIVGYRHFNDYDKAKNEIDKWISNNNKDIQDIKSIISGGATGADTLAKRYANEHHINMIEHLASWKKKDPFTGKMVYDRDSGKKRNTLIVNDCTHLIAFISKYSKGTWDTINKAEKAGKHVTKINID